MAHRSSSNELPTVRRQLPNGIDAAWSEVDPRIVRLIIETVHERRWPLLIHGRPGTGKSCTAALIHATWPTDRVKWFLAPEIVRLIQTARIEGCVRIPGSEQVVGEQNIWRVRIDQPDLLVLDDLGTRTPSESQYEILFEIIDRRRNRPMVVSTNHSPEALADVFDDRIVSRLTAGTVIEFDFADRRQFNNRSYAVRERLQVADMEERSA